MVIKSFTRSSFIFLASFVFISTGAIAEEVPIRQKPNVIFILADDLGYGDLGCYRATKVQTPQIDSLAQDGRLFTDAHSASAVCSPSRYAIMTGDYPFRKGLWGPMGYTLPLRVDTKRLTLSSLFKEAGYATAYVGKWHLGFGKGKCDWNKPLRPGPLELGFDYYFGVPKVNSGFPYVYVENDRPVGWDSQDPFQYNSESPSPTPEYPEKSPNQLGGALKAHQIYHDEKTGAYFTEKATDWIKQHKEQPFFLYFSTTNIHHPFTPAPRFQGTSQCGRYGDYIHEMDWMVGELLKTLDDLQLRDNTLVIFTSDNGGMYNEGGKDAYKAGHRINGDLLGFKFGAWEGGHRVPFIARWPKHIPANTRSDQLICGVDMISTMAGILGHKLKPADAVDSFNVLEAFIAEPSHQIRDHLLLAPRKQKNMTIRRGKWVYINAQGDGGEALRERGGPKAVADSGNINSDITADGNIKNGAAPKQLYNLDIDPGQKNNVIKQHPEIAKDLSVRLNKYRNSKQTRP